MGKRKKKSLKPVVEEEDPEDKVPKCFIFKRGKVGQYGAQLVEDMRKVMEPNTAAKLKESKKNQLKDFVNVSSQLGVTHFFVYSHSSMGLNLRLMRVPQGPTFTFRVAKFSLIRDVIAIQKRPHSPGSEYKHAPFLVLNNFSGTEEHKQLLSAMFQNMFPPIDVASLKISECRRVVLINYQPLPKTEEEPEEDEEEESEEFEGDEEEERGDGESRRNRRPAVVKFRGQPWCLELRHYLIKAAPTGINQSVKKLLKAKIPDMSRLEDISQYVLDPHSAAAPDMSDSDADDLREDNKLELPQDYTGRGNKASQKAAIRLKEIGPRMTLKLIKIEQELSGGRVLYHDYKKKSQAEVVKLAQQKLNSNSIKQARKQEQAMNIKRKEESLDKKKKRRKFGDVEEEGEDRRRDADAAAVAAEVDGGKPNDMDDAAYFKQETGEDADPGMFSSSGRGGGGGGGGERGRGRGRESRGRGRGRGGGDSRDRKDRSTDSSSSKKRVSFGGSAKKGDSDKGGRGHKMARGGAAPRGKMFNRRPAKSSSRGKSSRGKSSRGKSRK